MKSCISTLAIAAFALFLPANFVRADEGAPVVRATPLVDPAAAYGESPVQFASMPALAGSPVVGNPVVPISYYGAAGNGAPLAYCSAKSGKGGHCVCPQCRRERGGGGTWGSVEFMHLWMRGRNLPPLATTSPFPGTAVGDAGEMPTTVLFGDGRIGKSRQSAGRVDFGIWLDEAEAHGVGVKFFGIEGDRTAFNRTSPGDPILGIPFFNVDFATEDAFVAAYPAIFEGEINHHTANNLMMGDAYARIRMGRGFGYCMDFVGGYQVIRLDDSLGISGSAEVLANGQALPIGSTIDVYDSFKTRNEFHGGTMGFITKLEQECWTLSTLVKVTVANVNQSVTIAGSSIVDQGAGPVVIPDSGTFAQASNVGTYERDKITVVPELGFTMGYALNDCWTFTAGYTAMYFPNVLLAGDQVDRRVSPSQVTALPAFTFRETDQWAQAITFGLEWDY